jgi:hypothetical protein
MLDSYIGSIMNMTADVMIQENTQSPGSGTMIREWVYDRTIRCKVEPIKSSGASNKADNKRFDIGKHNEYDEKLQLKMKCLTPFSKRWRVTNLRSSDGKSVYFEIDRYDTPDTIFDVTASHAVLDPFGKVSYYEVTLQRVHIQNDSTASK